MPCTGSDNYSHRRFYHRTPKCGRCQVWSGYYNKCMDVKKERYGHHVQNELYPVFFVTFTNYSQDIHLNRNVVGAYSHKCGQCGVWSYRFCKCVRRTFCDLKPKPKPETGGMGMNKNFEWTIYDVRFLEGGCFALDSLVTTDAGKQKLMKDLEIGEEVLSDETASFTKFIGWMEMNKNTKVEMLEIQTEDGEKLTLTETHNVFYYEHGIPTAIYAKDLRPGNVLVGGSDKVQILPIFKYFFYLKH